jgi:arylsulfatase A-like enzyme
VQSIDASGVRRDGRLSLSKILGAWACCGLCSLAVGCSPGSIAVSTDADQSRVDAILDPQITAYGFEPQLNRFDGRGGTFFTGDGWAPPGEDSGGSFAWAMDSRASLWFTRFAVGEDLEFRALCRALSFDGAPPQEVTVRIGAQVVGSATIGNRWQEIVISIPDGVVELGLNRLDLEFSWSRKPADVGINQDRRKLSAAFRSVAVGASDRFEGDWFRFGPGMLDSGSGLLTLRPGEGVAVPVPSGSRFHADLAGTSRMAGSADIEIVYGHPGSQREEQWHERVDSDWTRAFMVENPDPGVGYFVVRNVSDPIPSEIGEVTAVLSWRPESFRISSIRQAQRREKPHVFIYLVDTVRLDSMALFGGARPTTPELEAFSDDAVVFENAVAASTWTLPSVVSILTGVYPFRHLVMKGDVQLSPESPHPTLATILGQQGFDTVGISQSYIVGPKFGLDTGFKDFFLANHLNGIQLRSQEVRRVLTQWLAYQHDWQRPVFAYVHTVGPHAPYRPTGSFRRFADAVPGDLSDREYSPAKFISEGYGEQPNEVEHLRALYEGEVEYADAEFGRFLGALKFFGLYDDAIVIFVSDHGEEFADHGGFDHGRTVFDEVARVPLVVKFPRWHSSGGTTIAERVSTVDIFATVLALAGTGADGTVIDGRPLPHTPTQHGSVDGDPRTVFTELNVVPNETYRSVNYRALWAGSMKCIENLDGTDRFGEQEPRYQAFDTGVDPGELSPLAEHDQRYGLCAEMLAGWGRVIGEDSSKSHEAPLASEETLEMLRSLGYIK